MGQGKPYNDYGLGFYCTESIDMAKEWAVGESSNGFANCYIINCKALSILNLCNKEYLLESFHTDFKRGDKTR